MFELIDHVGVAVSDLERATALYEGTFGMQVVHRETVESQGVEAVLLDVGDGHVELLRPLGPGTAVGKFIVQSLANVAELHRNLNAQNVKNRMKARLQTGYWMFGCPPGYVFQAVTGPVTAAGGATYTGAGLTITGAGAGT